MKSVIMASQSIMLGDRKIMLAGGMESMSKVPHYIYLRRPTGYGSSQVIDGIQYDGLTDVYNNILMGACTEKTASELGISRQAQDEYAMNSYVRARECQEKGIYDWEIVEITEEDSKGKQKKHTKDEECQKYFPDKFAGLRPAFSKSGTITAANSSKMNDGAAALVLMSEEAAKERGLQPLARIIGYEDADVQPVDFAIAPTAAVTKIMQKYSMNLKDIEYFEFNEAFSAVALANMKLLELDPERVNLHGGAVALGHPIGMSGTRVIISLLNVLRKKNATLGLASICNGGGGASAMIVERLN